MKSGKKWLYAFRWNPVISGSPVPDTGHVALPKSDVVLLITLAYLESRVHAVKIARGCRGGNKALWGLCESYQARPDNRPTLAHDE